MCHNSGSILVNGNDSAVFSGKIHIHLIDSGNTDFASAQRLSAHGHGLACCVCHSNIHSIGMADLGSFIGNKLVIQASLSGNAEGIGNPAVIGIKTQDTA